MVFLSICTALYDYVPQGEGELAIQEGEIIYILEKSSEDEWWKAKKKAPDEEDEEPVGLIPNNYVEEAQPTHHAKALYDYSRQTDEELSFTEESALLVYDTSDPDWTLVGLKGEFGFAPANYIEITSDAEQQPTPTALSPPLPQRASTQDVERDLPAIPPPAAEAQRTPASAIAGIMHKQETSRPARRVQFTPEASDEEDSVALSPALPQRPVSGQLSPQTPISAQYSAPRSPSPPGVIASPPVNRVNENFEGHSIPGGYHLYNVNEVVSVMGKSKKMPTTLGINLATGMITIIPAKKRDGVQQEWTAEKLTQYSIEGKHVFMELLRPSKSIDFHAGAKDTAQEIVSALGELAGASRAEGLREVAAASSGNGRGYRKGQMLYDFMAQGEDEVTVAVGDEVIILDDVKSEEWWMVRRIKNGKEGVVPSSYVEATGKASTPPPSTSGLNAGRSTVEQNRFEEENLAKEATRRPRENGTSSEVGPGLKLPNRGSSLTGGHDGNNTSSQRSKRDSRAGDKSSSSKTKPDPTKVRTWTDRSGTFKVDAQFVGLKDGKMHLHKTNGVKIAVPVVKMATVDLEYVERETGVSLDEDKPLSDIRRKSQKGANGTDRRGSQISPTTSTGAGASVQQPKAPEFDWFDFFLKCGVSPYQCERYSSNFNKDSMDESVLSDTTPAVLRTLGLKEGDILRVMKFLDTKFGRSGAKSKLRNVSFGGEEVMGEEEGEEGPTSPGGGLFSGPGGTLKNNTRKGRPAPTVQTNDTVDPKAFQQKDSDGEFKPPPIAKTATLTTAPKPTSKMPGGFDDDAWSVKPSKQPLQAIASSPPAGQPSAAAAPSQLAQPALTGAMADLSLLSQPLQPVIAHNTAAPGPPQVQQFSLSQQQQPNVQVQQPQTQQAAPQQQSFQNQGYAQNISNQQQQQQQQQLQQQPNQQLQPQATGASPAFFGQLGPQSNNMQQPQGMQQQPPQPNGPQAPQLQTFSQQPIGTGQSQFQVNIVPRQRPQPPPQFNPQGSLMPPPPPRPLSAPQNAPNQSSFGPPPLQPQLTGYQNQHAPPTQTLNDMNQLRMQQQFNQQQLQPQFTGMPLQGQGFNQFNNGIPQQQLQQNLYQRQQLQPQMTGIQPLYNGQQAGSPFADPRPQPQAPGFQSLSANSTGFQQQQPLYNSLQPQPTGSINSVLAPSLQPHNTGANEFGRPGFGQAPPPVPPIPQQPTLAPLQAQKTGPAPPVRFGVMADAKKLMPQPTGRANLSKATPQNPFGF